MRAQQVKGGRHVAVFWDAEIQLEVGVEMVEAFVETEDLVRSATPAGLIAHATHYGPYGELRKTHDAVRRWCATHGHTLAGPNWEIYGHWLSEWNERPMQIRTDVFYQVITG